MSDKRQTGACAYGKQGHACTSSSQNMSSNLVLICVEAYTDSASEQLMTRDLILLAKPASGGK